MTESQREKRNRENRERYAFLKEHGMCVYCGKEKAAPGKVSCLLCADNNVQKATIYNQYKRDREEYNAYMRELRRKRKEAGMCQSCGRPTHNGKVFCSACGAVRAQRQKDRRREKGIMARDLFGNGYYCTFCGKDVEKYGDKCCPVCLERERKWSAEQRKKIDRTNHWWKKDNNIVFHKGGQ